MMLEGMEQGQECPPPPKKKKKKKKKMKYKTYNKVQVKFGFEVWVCCLRKKKLRS